MIPVLYIPWFRETNTKRDPGVRLEEYCDSIWAWFQRVVFPGDTDSWDETLFSMSWLAKRIEDVLVEQKDICKVVSYSLSAIPTFEVISRYLERVQDILFLSPVRNPVYSVSMMDWALRNAESPPHWLEHFLNGDPEQVFSNLIWDWNGDATQFQQDLNTYNNTTHKYFEWDEHYFLIAV